MLESQITKVKSKIGDIHKKRHQSGRGSLPKDDFTLKVMTKGGGGRKFQDFDDVFNEWSHEI